MPEVLHDGASFIAGRPGHKPRLAHKGAKQTQSLGQDFGDYLGHQVIFFIQQ